MALCYGRLKLTHSWHCLLHLPQQPKGDNPGQKGVGIWKRVLKAALALITNDQRPRKGFRVLAKSILSKTMSLIDHDKGHIFKITCLWNLNLWPLLWLLAEQHCGALDFWRRLSWCLTCYIFRSFHPTWLWDIYATFIMHCRNYSSCLNLLYN